MESFLVAQEAGDPALSLPWLKFDPWPQNVYRPWVQEKKKRKM